MLLCRDKSRLPRLSPIKGPPFLSEVFNQVCGDVIQLDIACYRILNATAKSAHIAEHLRRRHHQVACQNAENFGEAVGAAAVELKHTERNCNTMLANRSEVAVEDSYVGIPFPFQILLPIAQYSLHLPGLANILQPHSNDAHGY